MMIKFFKDGGAYLITFIGLALIAGTLDLLCGCAHDFGAREMPKQSPGQADSDYWEQLKREGWF